MSRRALLVLLVLGLAAFWRLHGLATWSLDGDELYSHYDVLELRAGHLAEGVRSYPLGYLLMSGSVALLGTGEAGLRAAPMLCGFLAVAALLLLRRDAVSAGAALTAGALAALSPWLIYHAQEARFYAPLLLLATLATLWALPGPGQRPWLSVLCGLLAAACHPSALLLLPVLVGIALRRHFRSRTVLGLAAAAAGGGAAWLLVGGGALPRLVQGALARRTPSSYDVRHFVSGLGYAFGPALLLLALPGVLLALRAPRAGDRLLLALAALPLALLAVSAAGVSVQQRYAMAAVPAVFLLAGRGVEALVGAPRWRAALLGLALLAPAPQLLAYAQDGDRADWRGASAWLAEHARPDDIVISDEHALLDLYLTRKAGWEQARSLEESLVDEKKRWNFVRDRHEVWVVLKASRLGAAYGAELEAWLDEHFVETTRLGPAPPPLTVHDNRLVVLQRKARVTDNK